MRRCLHINVKISASAENYARPYHKKQEKFRIPPPALDPKQSPLMDNFFDFTWFLTQNLV